jgi:hypothetical protein
MKIGIKIICLMAFISVCSVQSMAQNQKFTLKAGTILIYEVESQNQKYDFTINIEEITPSIVFTFKMSNARKTSGKITITKEALKNAIAQYNYFQSNEVTLDKQTTVWVSKKVWNNLKKRKKCNISTNSGEMNLKTLELIKSQDFPVKMNDQELSLTTMYCVTNDTNAYKYWILDDINNPLILKMELNFSIELKEIKFKE